MKKLFLIIPLLLFLSSCEDDLPKEEKDSQKQEVIAEQTLSEREVMGENNDSQIINTLASAYLLGKVIDGASEIGEELIEKNNDSKRYDYWKNDSYKMNENNFDSYKNQTPPLKKTISAPEIVFKKSNVPQKKSKCIFCGSSKKSSWGSSKSSGSSFFKSSSFKKR